ncbi:hypothetical protein IGL14_002630 [Enterococcus sp. DIV1938]|nr:site-specific recombinase, phage integrase family [Enterococcus faecalis 06-MB-S-10]EPH91181.1 site-specific recombinase, phage integrase family [Enterococcus faecalis 06-MB-S-04]
MKTVEPIKNKRALNKMKKSLRKGKYGDRNVLLFSIGINTAYRISDLRKLKLSDVLEREKEEIKVKVKERLSLIEQKTGKYNSVILSDRLKTDIEKYVKTNFSHYLSKGELEHYLFPSGKGKDQPMNRQTLWSILNKAAKENNIPNVGSHSMRKTFGYFYTKTMCRLKSFKSY